MDKDVEEIKRLAGVTEDENPAPLTGLATTYGTLKRYIAVADKELAQGNIAQVKAILRDMYKIVDRQENVDDESSSNEVPSDIGGPGTWVRGAIR